MSCMDEPIAPDKTPVVQCLLRHGSTEITAWVTDVKKLRKGSRVTLKGKEGWWQVIEIYSHKATCELNRGWNVGGL